MKHLTEAQNLPEPQNLQTEPRNLVLNMPATLNAIVYRDLHGALERPSKRERDSISPKDGEDEEDPLDDEEDEEYQLYGHSGSEYMSEEEGEAPGDNRENPASNDRTDAFEAKLEKLTLDHETFKLNYETFKLHHETLKLNHEMLKLNYESHKEKTKVRLGGLVGRVSQGTRATNWVFGRLRATTKTADAAAKVAKSLWRDLREQEAMPRPTRSPAVVTVASFGNPDANPEYWAE